MSYFLPSEVRVLKELAIFTIAFWIVVWFWIKGTSPLSNPVFEVVWKFILKPFVYIVVGFVVISLFL